MNTTLKSTAEARLDAAFAAAGIEDPRPAMRAQLKRLRAQDAGAFERAVRMYEEDVIPALAAGEHVLDTWMDYTRTLGALLAGGQFMTLDASGRAAPYAAPYQPGDLVLHLPDESDVPVIPAALPVSPSPHQQAALDLLVHGHLGS